MNTIILVILLSGGPVDSVSMQQFQSAEACEAAASWLVAELHPPPRGVLLQVVTIGGVLVKSQWSDEWGIAWGPLPQIPETVKQRQRDRLARLIAGG